MLYFNGDTLNAIEAEQAPFSSLAICQSYMVDEMKNANIPEGITKVKGVCLPVPDEVLIKED